ncbi:MAG: hypothetical protein J6C06_01130 [Lachnospiraceae bacterium]|nr:hypothetical protein [Lachnospiraceae bacterium]
MIYKCPNCNGALEYNPITDEMECAHCGGGYTVAEMEASQEKVEHTFDKNTGSEDVLNDGKSTRKEAIEHNSENVENLEDNHFLDDLETMQCKIYTCTSCGAELVMNENEAASFCAYCGQPTVVFSRVSNELKPQSIIPFKITKEQAINGVREYLKDNFFVPNEIKNFSTDKVRGIYVPYWVFDIYYYDQQLWEAIIEGKNGTRNVVHYEREAECMFQSLTADASKNLNNELSQRLEPYDVRTKKPFEAAYLSGYYADKYDLDENYMEKYAYLRAKNLFDAEIKQTLPGGVLKYSQPKHSIKKAEYMLLPAWFVTFRYNYETYTIAVNGQNGKIVGTVPFDKKKVIGLYLTIAVIASVLITLIIMISVDGSVESLFGMLPVNVILFILFGFTTYKLRDMLLQIKYTTNLTKSYQTADYVQERQDRD